MKFNFVLKRGTSDHVVIDKQCCATLSSNQRGHHIVFAKSLLKEAIKFHLYNCFFSIGNIIMIQVIGIPVGSDPVLFFANLFQVHKEADWVKAQRKLGTIIVRKVNNSFRFIDDLLSLNDASTFEKHYKDIYPTELELEKKIIPILLPLFLIFTFTLKMDNSILNYLTKEVTGFDIVKMPFYCSNVPIKMFYGCTGQSFLKLLEQPVN